MVDRLTCFFLKLFLKSQYISIKNHILNRTHNEDHNYIFVYVRIGPKNIFAEKEYNYYGVFSFIVQKAYRHSEVFNLY